MSAHAEKQSKTKESWSKRFRDVAVGAGALAVGAAIGIDILSA